MSSPIAQDAFPKWLDLLGVDPAEFAVDYREPAEYSITLGEMGRMEMAVAVFNCLSLNDGELTAQLMLSYLVDEFTREQSFTVHEILREPGKTQRTLELVKGIRAVLDRDEVVLRRGEFSESLLDAIRHYGAQDREDVREMIENDGEMAILRRSALTALHDISIAQFLQGEAGSCDRPQYSTVIRRWWSIDHMLAAHASIPEGVSLNMVKTPEDHDMFFCFVVRRGGNLYVLNDAPDYEHPLQSQMSRRPDRHMAERIAKFWFPYDLADVEVSEDGREARVSSGHAKGGKKIEAASKLSPVSQVVGSIAELAPRELLWTVMMFDLIMDKFWAPGPLVALPLSYTATQLKPEGQLLLEAARLAGLPVVLGQSGHLAAPDLSVRDVAALHHAPDAAAVLGETGNYQSLVWMENRYAAKIPEQALNQIAAGSEMARIGHDGALQVITAPDHKVMERERFFGKDNSLVDLTAMEQTRFGTAEQLRADRAFLARSNYARTIGAFARQEYDQRRDEVRDWLAQAYAKRVEFFKTLVPAAHAKGLKVVDWAPGAGPGDFSFKGGYAVDFTASRPGFREKGEQARGCSHRLGWLDDVDGDSTAWMTYLRQGGETSRGWKPLCQVTGQKASYYFAVRPTNAAELAWVLGLDISELPDVLQSHSALAPTCGNQILNRIDPMLWALKNPWHELQMGARMALSKRGLSQLLKDHSPVVDLSHLDGYNLRAFRPATPSRRLPHP